MKLGHETIREVVIYYVVAVLAFVIRLVLHQQLDRKLVACLSIVNDFVMRPAHQDEILVPVALEVSLFRVIPRPIWAVPFCVAAAYCA